MNKTESALPDMAEKYDQVLVGRTPSGDNIFSGALFNEIERLQAEVAALTASNEIMRQASEKYNDEIDHLRAEKETLSRELSVYMEAVTKMENAIHGL